MEKIVGTLSYNTNAIIGHGSFGTVFIGFHRDSSVLGGIRRVAIKQMQRSNVKESELFVLDQKSRHSLLRMKVMKLMKQAADDHPNILPYLSIEENNDYLFIATDLCRGNLQNYVEGKYKGPAFNSEQDILRQMTQGLVHLHKLGIVHGNIKPTNILIFVPTSADGDGSTKPLIKLADFGLANFLKADDTIENVNFSSVTQQSRGWMAPEQYNNVDSLDFKVDIFPLGCIFGYTLSRGKHPFGDDGPTRISRIKEIRSEELEEYLNNYYPDDQTVSDLIKSMLAMESYKRPTAEEVLNHKFFLTYSDQTSQLMKMCQSFQESIDEKGIISQFEMLIGHEEVDINAITQDGKNQNPLHLLCRNYNSKILISLITLLLEKGADVSSKARYGWTCLHYLCKYYKQENLIDIVQLLIQHGGNVNASSRFGTTPLLLLCEHYREDNLVDIIKFLVQNGADVNARERNYGWTILHSLCESYKNENLIDIVLLLLEKYVDVQAQTIEDQETPLNLLCKHYPNDNLIDIIKLFIEKGNADVTAKNKDGWTPLHSLCDSYKNDNLIDIVELLIHKGANVNANTKERETPLSILCDYYPNANLIDIIKLLIEKGADVKAKKENGSTSLHSLCQVYNHGNLMEIVQVLVEKGADVNAKTIGGETPLHWLCENYKKDDLLDIIQLLLRNGADVNARTVERKTPIYCLCENNTPRKKLMKIVKQLRQQGADWNAKTIHGSTPADFLHIKSLTPRRFANSHSLTTIRVRELSCSSASLSPAETSLDSFNPKDLGLNRYDNEDIPDAIRGGAFMALVTASRKCAGSSRSSDFHNPYNWNVDEMLEEPNYETFPQERVLEMAPKMLSLSAFPSNVVVVPKLPSELETDRPFITPIREDTLGYFRSIELPRTLSQSSRAKEPKGTIWLDKEIGRPKLICNSNQIIGRGSFGTIVYHGLLNNTMGVAIKRIQLSNVKNKFIQRARKDPSILKLDSNDPNILPYLCIQLNEDFLLIATELCAATLQDWIENKYFGPSVGDEREILFQVTQGLDHLHKNRIIHRDIMPTNILISKPEGIRNKTPQIKLADFGLIRDVITDYRNDTNFTSKGKTIMNPMGTEGWIAPELYHSDDHDSKVDIFSLGILFYYTLTGGEHPFGIDANIQTVRIIKKEIMVVMPDVLKSPYWEDLLGSKLIQWMLEMEPGERPTTQEILGHGFFLENQQKTTSSSINMMQTKNVLSPGIQDIKAQMGSKYILGMHLNGPNQYKRYHRLGNSGDSV